MAVYVDDMRAKFRRMVMCHMIADTEEELHAMAAHIGISKRWHQSPPEHFSHYDICMKMRALAITAGALEITWRQCSVMCQRRDKTGVLGHPDEAMAWRSQEKSGLQVVFTDEKIPSATSQISLF